MNLPSAPILINPASKKNPNLHSPPSTPPQTHKFIREKELFKMVFLTHSICRIARLAAPSSSSRSVFTAATSARAGFQCSAAPRVSSRGALALRHDYLGSIRTLTGKREKVKVLLVLYDGKEHAKQVRSTSSILSRALHAAVSSHNPPAGSVSSCNVY